MYNKFYGFRERPFSLLPDPAFLFPSARHHMGLVLLEYSLLNCLGISVITGGIGTGKTTLIRCLLRELEDDVTIGVIVNTHRGWGDMLPRVLSALNLGHVGKGSVEMLETFSKFLTSEHAANRRPLLVVDEAQNLTTQMLEELRTLSNVNTDKAQLLQLILVGQDGLRRSLGKPELEQLAQRVAVDYRLEPLTRRETAEYIRYRLKVAGCTNAGLITDGACEAVYHYSRGVPRLINMLCDTALVYGFADRKHSIDSELIHDGASDRRTGGILPIANPAGDHAERQLRRPAKSQGQNS
jgi:general secretion pathway protein A